MPELDGFSAKARNRRVPREGGYINQPNDAPARKGPYDKSRCPAGWDADLWHLALLFEQYARADGIELRASRPIIYAEIAEMVTQYNMRRQDFRQEVHGCERRMLGADVAARCWYHWPPDRPADQVAGQITWVQKVEIIMAELWSCVQDEHALDRFRQRFPEYGRAAAKHWRSLSMIRQIDERPKQPRPVMRRAKMQADSEEG